MDDSDNETVIVDDSNEKYWTSGNELSYLKMQMDEIRGRLSVVETRKLTSQLVAKSVEQQHDKFVKEQLAAVKEQLQLDLDKQFAAVKEQLEQGLEKQFAAVNDKLQQDLEKQFVAVKEQLEQGLEKQFVTVKEHLQQDLEKHLEKPFGTMAIKKQVDQETRDLKGKKEPVQVSSRRKRTRI